MDYNNGGLNIFNEDALDFLLRVGDESIDLIYCDLPFGVTQCGWDDVYGSFNQVQVKSGGKRYPRSVQYFKTAESEGKTWHKTQKPKALCKYIIETYSRVGDIVLDFAAGSGTAGVGVEIGRTVILVEKDLNEYDNLKKRWNIN
jgi:DNA modification methylase